jgi:hypothetical protein
VDQKSLETLTCLLSDIRSRRTLLGVLAGAGLGLGAARWPERAEARKKGKDEPKKKQGLCARDGSRCPRPGKHCKKSYCLSAPFTVEATWTQSADHDTYLFYPQGGTIGPFPFINSNCTPNNSLCEERYPYACFDGNEKMSGNEVATLHRLSPGTYEYWIALDGATPAGELTIVLKDNRGRTVRQWQNPATAAQATVAWHVFDINGRDGRVTSVDVLNDEPGPLPQAAHDPSDHVCPGD